MRANKPPGAFLRDDITHDDESTTWRADFTVAEDIAAIAPISVAIANRFAEYEASGSLEVP